MIKKRGAAGSAARSVAAPKDPVLAWLAALALGAFALWSFSPVLSADFINFDDGDYILNNPAVRAGLGLKSAWWAMTATYASNWHPLTWLSHMLDVSLFGLDPGAHHRTNLLLHLASATVLLLALRRLTGRFWPSLLVAGIFALHPLRVESVAWVAERKDVLSGLFFFLALYVYAGYGRRPSIVGYLLLALVTGLGLMAKSMLVTLPCVLLLLDWWPLGRLGAAAVPVQESKAGKGKAKRATARVASETGGGDKARAKALARCVLEKLPLLALSGLAAWLTVLASRQAGAMASLQELGLAHRLGNAVTACARYLLKLAAPVDLAVYYPIRVTPAWEAGMAAALLLAITLAAVGLRRKAPYLLVGWLWFLGMLVPVVGLVQVGGQALADRYTYLPSVGLTLALVWGGAELWARLGAARRRRAGLASLAVLLLAVLGLGAHEQAGHWRDSETLYLRTLAVTEKNFIVRYNYAKFLSDRGREAEAIAQYEACLEAHPGYAKGMNNLAWLLATSPDDALRDGKRAVELADRALSLSKGSFAMLDTLAAALAAAGEFEEAAATAREAEEAAAKAGQTALAADMGARRVLYEQGMAYRAPRRGGS
jgi:tetratricopeptide (TPR) repeat protein